MKAVTAVLLGLLLLGATVATPLSANQSGYVGGRFPTEERFVDQAYRDVLSRPADPGGLASWSRRLRSGVPPAALIEQLLTSEEFGGTTAPVVRLYRSIFDRQPDLEGLRFWVERRQRGESLTRLAQQMLAGAEFGELNAAADIDAIVTAVFGRSLGRAPDEEGLAFWIEEIASGRRSLAGFVAAVSESPEHRALRSGDVLTTLSFLALLQRVPDNAGLNYWSERLESGEPLVTLLGSMMGTPEYLGRFAPAPTVRIEVVATGLTIPWDIESLPDGTLVFTERRGRLGVVPPGGTARLLAADFSASFISGETGVMGLAVDPDFARNRRIYVCQGHAAPREIRVVVWTLDNELTVATRGSTLVGGLPIVSGRHGGCQLEFGADGHLYVGTGDAAVGTNPQDLASLGGKVLRVDAATGRAPSDNPFVGSANPATRLIYSYGHRNVQGLALRPGTDEMWSVEHGPTRDDEVNRLIPGANAGWNPVGPSGYDESVPMTDRRLADALDPAWSTGSPTLALSGGDWLDDPSWGSWNGGLGLAALKNQTLRLVFFSPEGAFLGDHVIIDGAYGRLRAVHQAPNGSLYVSTSRGNDQILRITAAP